jgi:2-polyprenyl-3-methyl-5-hydroxy-6-metoxy-1,4-benzoquinol methylase
VPTFSEAEIVESWRKNAASWTEAVRRRQIQSRKLVTNRAIVDAILGCSPRSVLDVGCGEGWLARALAAEAIRVSGVDVVSELIDRAQGAGGGDFTVASYEDIAAGRFTTCVDAIVCNFSLLGSESVEGVFSAVPKMLNPGGAFIVQTLHPIEACGDLPYQDGWRVGSWVGFSSDFVDPAPWYFRTFETWKNLFSGNGLELVETREPIHPETQRPASVIFIARVCEQPGS